MSKAIAPRGYTQPETEFALQALALYAGNARRAVKAMEAIPEEDRKAMGVAKIPDFSLLYTWPKRYPQIYEPIRDKTMAPYREKAAEAHSAQADAELEVASEILQLIREKKGELDARDLANTLRNLDTGAAINRDKASLLRGESQGGLNINVSIGDQVRSFAASGSKIYDKDGNEISPDKAVAAIEGTAEEVNA